MKTSVYFRIIALACLCFAGTHLTAQQADDAAAEVQETKCVNLELIWLENQSRWGVFVQADADFTPPDYTTVSSGRVTIVVPFGFNYTGLSSKAGGKWKPGAVYFNPPQAPGRQFMTFELTPNNNQLLLSNEDSVMLFSFAKTGPCPDTMYLMDNYVPEPLQPNAFTGTGLGLGFEPDVEFGLCSVLNREGWNCNPAPPAEGLAIPVPFENTLTADEMDWFRISPNPVESWTEIVLLNEIEDSYPTLRILNVQGQMIAKNTAVTSNKTRLQLDGLTPGVYFIVLEANGKILQREKLMKQ